MDKSTAEVLLEELRKHNFLVEPDREKLLELLVSTNIPELKEFAEILPENNQLIEGELCYHYLILDRVLRNRNVRILQRSRLKEILRIVKPEINPYSPKSLTRDLLRNTAIAEIMAKCKEPYSLLGKLKTYTWNNPQERLFELKRPLLIIPGGDERLISHWEEVNTSYKEVILPFGRRITEEEYVERMRQK